MHLKHVLFQIQTNRGYLHMDGPLYVMFQTIILWHFDAGGGRRPPHHFCRRFYDIAKAGNAPIASEALHRISELYAIEAEISGRSANERRANRQARTQPLVEALRIWLDEQLERVPCRSPVAEAMRYGTNHCQGLCRFLDDGRIEIDTT